MAKGAITARLVARGWHRSETAEGECGAVGEYTGYCVRIAKWERNGITFCAAHALGASQSRGERW